MANKLISKADAIMDIAESSTNKIFGLKPVTKDRRPFSKKMSVPWYFDTFFSKAFLLFLLFMTIYAIARIIVKGWW